MAPWRAIGMRALGAARMAAMSTMVAMGWLCGFPVAPPDEILVRMAVPPVRRRILASDSSCSPDLVSSTVSLNHTGNSDLAGMWHDIPSVCASPAPDWSGHQLLESGSLRHGPGTDRWSVAGDRAWHGRGADGLGCAIRGAPNCVEAWGGVPLDPVSVEPSASKRWQRRSHSRRGRQTPGSASRSAIRRPARPGLLSSRFGDQVQPSVERRPPR
jgi:hypothetical protein